MSTTTRMTARTPGDIPPAGPTAAHRRAVGWFNMWREAPAKSHPWLQRLAFSIFALCILGLIGQVRQTVRDSAESIPSPVSYVGAWRTDKHIYHPGDLMRLSYERHATEGRLLLWQVDSWENEETGAAYPEPIRGRYVRAAGVERVIQVRSLPANLPPGTYRLRGWISAQTSRRSLPAGYTSEKFRVVAPEKKGR